MGVQWASTAHLQSFFQKLAYMRLHDARHHHLRSLNKSDDASDTWSIQLSRTLVVRVVSAVQNQIRGVVLLGLLEEILHAACSNDKSQFKGADCIQSI